MLGSKEFCQSTVVELPEKFDKMIMFCVDRSLICQDSNSRALKGRELICLGNIYASRNACGRFSNLANMQPVVTALKRILELRNTLNSRQKSLARDG